MRIFWNPTRARNSGTARNLYCADRNLTSTRCGLDLAKSLNLRLSSVAVRQRESTFIRRTPDRPWTYGVRYGDLDEVQIDNMSLQNRDWTAGHRERARPSEIRAGVSVVAVASGRGLAVLFMDAGCAAIVPGGQLSIPARAKLSTRPRRLVQLT